MAGKYAKLWFKVHEAVSRAQKEAYLIVEDMCRLLTADLAGTLEEVRRNFEFTYVIEPRQGNGDIMRCVPCLVVDGSVEAVQAVRKTLRAKHKELLSESRLVVERKPRQPTQEQL